MLLMLFDPFHEEKKQLIDISRLYNECNNSKNININISSDSDSELRINQLFEIIWNFLNRLGPNELEMICEIYFDFKFIGGSV